MSIFFILFGFMFLMMIITGVTFVFVARYTGIEVQKRQNSVNRDEMFVRESKRDRMKRRRSLKGTGLVSKNEYDVTDL